MGSERPPAQDLIAAVLDAAAKPLLLLAPDGVIRGLNSAFAALVDRDPAGLVGRDVAELLAPERVGDAQRLLADSPDLGPPHRLELVRADRRRLLVHATAQLLRGNECAVLGTLIVVEDPAHSIIQQAGVDAVLDAIPGGLWVSDRDGRALLISRGMEQIIGSPKSEIMGFGWLDRIHPDDRSAVEDAWRNSTLEGTPFESVFRYLPESGAERTVHERGGPIHAADGTIAGYVGISRDVTAERRAQDEAERRDELLRGMAAVAPLGLFSCDTAGDVTYASPYASTILGVERDALDWLDLIHPDDAAEAQAEWARYAAAPVGVSRVEYRIVRPGGEIRWIVDVAQATFAADGGFSGLAGALIDVTERISVQRRLERRLAQQALSAAIGRRALDASTPLPELIGSLCGEAKDLLEANAVIVLRLPPEAPGLGVVVAGAEDRHVPDHAPDTVLTLEPPYPADPRLWMEIGERNPLRLAVDSLSVVVSTDRENDPRFAAADDGWEWLRAVAVAPIVVGGRLWGVLAAAALAANSLHEDEADFLDSLANVIAGALERDGYEAELRRRSLLDPLTGLPNRLRLLELLEAALDRRSREAPPIVALVEVDHFKHINDAYGHHTGDELLIAIATRLAEECGADHVARLGGDEFVLVWEGGGKRPDELGTRIVGRFQAPFALTIGEVFASVSVGLVAADGRPTTADVLVRSADTAMYRAKELGRNRFALFGDELRNRAAAHVETASAVRHALGRDELVLHYQPVVRLDDGRLIGFEALVRWRRPGHERLVMPGDFIELAEDTGLIQPIGLWVAEEACRRLAAWNDLRGDQSLRVSLNVSARQIAGPGAARELVAIAERSGILPGQLALELTESVLVDESETALEFVRDARAAGVLLAIDDFGTGYASMRYLRRFSPDELKLDRSFVQGIGRSDADTAIVVGTIQMAHALGLSVTAEGIEEADQALRLRDLECEHAQGFHFSRPVDLEAATRLVAAANRPRPDPLAPLGFDEHSAAADLA